ncbi:nucleotidyl transferase AbiEii/AbiGii toxin family protein [Candidatus Micrarchaeota archaeon]|nr:nucleotidyl transferase AbiEii/AbiGii toxin family protein [Candidatus Micrarchaeota archaeon]
MFEEINLQRFVAELSRLTGYSNNLVEKDVWQKLVLEKLYSSRELQDKLVFKGGTCITRTLFGYYRFSEDLDFVWTTRQSRAFYKTFSRLYLGPLSETGVTAGKHYGTFGGRLMKWDLICNSSKLVLSVNFSQELAFPIVHREVFSIKIGRNEGKKLSVLYPSIFSAYYARLVLPCYSPEEIACEKFAAILTRRDLAKPRDLIDLLHLKKSVDLHTISEDRKALGKITRLIKSAPAYSRIFGERKRNLPAYLKQLAEEALNEREIYIAPLNEAELRKFVESTLTPLLEKIVKEVA